MAHHEDAAVVVRVMTSLDAELVVDPCMLLLQSVDAEVDIEAEAAVSVIILSKILSKVAGKNE